MSGLKSGRFCDTSVARRTKAVALGLGASGTRGADGPCPTAPVGKHAIVHVAITSTPKMGIACQPSNTRRRRFEDSAEITPVAFPSPDSGQHTFSGALREIATHVRMRVSEVAANTVRRTYLSLSKKRGCSPN